MFKKKITFVMLVWSFLLFFANPMHAKHAREEVDNAVGVFIGSTYDGVKNMFTYGFEYHRIVSFPFGFLLDGENIPRNREGDSEYEVFSLAVMNFHPHFIVGVGPGLKFAKEERGEDEGKKNVEKLRGRLFLAHVIALPNEFELVPNASLDFIEGTRTKEVNFGFTFSKSF